MYLLARYYHFIAASGLTNLADGIATVAWAWLASLLTRDPLLVALMPVALRLPWFFCAVPAGIVTDRVDRKRLILMMDMVRGLAFAMASVWIWSALPLQEPSVEGVTNGVLYLTLLGAALLVGVAEVFRDNAAQTMIPNLVQTDQLERANGRLWSVEMTGNELLGPALAAFLLVFALPLPFAVNAAAYLAATLLVSRIPGVFRPQQSRQKNWRHELREGFVYLVQAPLLRTLAIITGVWNLLFHMSMIGLVLHVQENLDLGARAYGLIIAFGALGGISGGWLAEPIVKQLCPKRAAQISLMASFPAFIGFACAPGPVSLSIVLAIFGFMGVLWNTVSVSYRQRSIPNELLGRVNALYRLLAWGMIPLGLLLSGVSVRAAETLVDRGVALVTPFVLSALGALLLGIIGWRSLNRHFTFTGAQLARE